MLYAFSMAACKSMVIVKSFLLVLSFLLIAAIICVKCSKPTSSRMSAVLEDFEGSSNLSPPPPFEAFVFLPPEIVKQRAFLF